MLPRGMGGKQRIHADGTVIPLKMQRALLYTFIREPTEWELKNLPRVMLTSDEFWDPGKITDSITIPRSIIHPVNNGTNLNKRGQAPFHDEGGVPSKMQHLRTPQKSFPMVEVSLKVLNCLQLILMI